MTSQKGCGKRENFGAGFGHFTGISGESQPHPKFHSQSMAEAGWREQVPTPAELENNQSSQCGFTKHGWGVFKCNACGYDITMVKHLLQHWAGKRHIKSIKEVGVQPKTEGSGPTSKVVAPNSAVVKETKRKGRGSHVCLICFECGHSEDQCEARANKTRRV